MSKTFQICTKTVMDTTDPDITFDENGICHYYHQYHNQIKQIVTPSASKEESRKQLIAKIKKDGQGNDYDCVIGISGGVDSSYLAYHLKAKEGLRPLAVHLDGGWNSELAVKNIENLLKKLDIDLYTHVIDWEEMKDLQVAFFKSGVANQDIPQDHAIVALLFKVAKENNIRYILSGHNLATEFVLPVAWGYNALDSKHLKSIHRKFGHVKLRTYPFISMWDYYFISPFLRRIKIVKFLNYIDYDKKEAMKILERDLGWTYYGGKHYESRFTKFFQSYFLTTRFGYDKRKAHLSSLILSDQMTREEALRELEKPLYTENELKEDKEFIRKKLDLSAEEFERILQLPVKTYRDYPSNNSLFILLKTSYNVFLKMKSLLNSKKQVKFS